MIKVTELKRPAIAKKRRDPYFKFMMFPATGKAMIEIMRMKQKNVELTPHPILVNSILWRG